MTIRSFRDRIRAARTAILTERSARLQLAGTLVGGITVALLLVFLFGEVAEGDMSGLAHAVQVAPLLALLAFGWWRPGLAGALLLAAASALVAAYFVETSDSTVSRSEQFLVAGLFLLPPVLAGVLFLTAARAGVSRPALTGMPNGQ